jgi:dolichyl-phosphate-mannose-protein mannosyltransferase
MPSARSHFRSLKVWLPALPGVAVIWIAAGAAALRLEDGSLGTAGWAWMVAGLSLAIAGAGWRTRWQAPAGWLALALAGQACALQLIDAPPFDVYQHYHPWRAMLGRPWVFLLAASAVQTLIVVRGVRPYRESFREHAARVPVRHRMMLLAFLGFAAALGSEKVAQYGAELTLTAWLSIVGLLNVFLVAASLPSDAVGRTATWLGARFHPEEATRWNRALPWVVAAWVLIVTGCLASLVLDRVPVIQDSVSYLFQAKYFSLGRLYLPAPPDPKAFEVSHIINDGTKWFAYGFPGWPAVLAVGVLAGAPWLVNPVLAALFVLLAHALVRRLYGWPLAHAVALLLAVSPWFLFLSASHMPHAATIVWTAIAWLALERARSTQRIWWGFASGVALAALFLTRPLEGILVGGTLGLFALGFGGSRLSVRPLAALIVACVAVSSVIFPYNARLTGDPLNTPQALFRDRTAYPGADRFGFGADVGNLGWPHLDPLPGHGPADVVINLNRNLYQTNVELFGWVFPSLLLAVLPFVLRSVHGADRLMLAVLVAVVGGHSFYWFSGGPDFGARYWYQILLPLVVFTARGAESIRQRLRLTSSIAASRVPAFVAVVCVMSMVNFVPWRSLGKYHRYREMTADVQRLARDRHFGESLVFVRVEAAAGSILNNTDYPSAFIFNPPSLESGGTVYAFDAGPAHRRAVMDHFPGRPIWVIGRIPTAEQRAAGLEASSRISVIDGPRLPDDAAGAGPAALPTRHHAGAPPPGTGEP